ncbi:MAG: amino acid ABC transporter substrate-binding protein [Candidatus Electrothrix aestuarii]|uniref:Amino acid ABC transporter substrate-binding protein n=1 Tax=Candidatus Electrothrix aestuarii TaxID=3062594 RepID=A0AAU8M198_9BACT|nr:amino acid ABC transporter substrate-binding protein [Candidatus Electrothrix aestuarii]WPD23845.1 MAG: amino acid ABC transporter substrate-binding protein [Candidatus Electrothrix sp. GW3-3]
MKKYILSSLVTFLFLLSVAPIMAGTLDEVKKRGTLVCGVSTGLPGFSATDEKGHWKGLDVDGCRAIAAAVFGDAKKVKYVPLNAKERFTALQSGEIDVLVRGTTWTKHRDTALGLNFAGVNYYDGQGFMVSKKLGVKSAKDLDGAIFCIHAGTTTELNLADYFSKNNMRYEAIVFDTHDQAARGFEAGRCDCLTSDQSQLYALRTHLSKPYNAVVLKEVISKEPLGPVVRQGDDPWFNVVRWAFFAMINAEELRVTSANVDAMRRDSKNPDVQRLLGLDGDKGKSLGLSEDWSYQIIKQVGNYAESFERNVGKGSTLKIKRGLNALWKDGGILYAPPMR